MDGVIKNKVGELDKRAYLINFSNKLGMQKGKICDILCLICKP